ncbi:hypothetical protein GCM10010430_77150 [Kitasatospora cystarginea]|uniref:Uncharacterized protein n=1 Tax=Kitasatospora cystarginea TaxID=58350 RepID=A0ABP5S0I9_9ACTN
MRPSAARTFGKYVDTPGTFRVEINGEVARPLAAESSGPAAHLPARRPAAANRRKGERSVTAPRLVTCGADPRATRSRAE